MSIEVTKEAAELLTSPRVDALFAAIKSANDELEIIRGTCEHPSYFLAWWSWGPGHFSACRVCAVCRDHIDGITEAERERLGPLFPEQDAAWRVVRSKDPA